MLRRTLIQENIHEPSTSQKARTEFNSMVSNASFDDILDDFEVPKRIHFKLGGADVVLEEGTTVYTYSNCQVFNDFLMNSAAYWHLILVRFYLFFYITALDLK